MRHLIVIRTALAILSTTAAPAMATTVDMATWFEGYGFRPPSDCTYTQSPLHQREGDNYWTPLGMVWHCVDSPYGEGKVFLGIYADAPHSPWEPAVGAYPVVGGYGSLIYEKGAHTPAQGVYWVSTGNGGGSCECFPITPPPIPLPASVFLLLSGMLGMLGFTKYRKEIK